MGDEPENLVLQLLRDMRSDFARLESKMATKDELSDVTSEIRSLRADVASDLMTLEKRLGDQIVGLRRSVMEYHSSAIGHGVLITELEERVRRLEQHLKLTPPEAH